MNTETLEDKIFNAKKEGLSDEEIGKKFNVSLHFIEKVITQKLGVNVSNINIKKKIKTLEPKNFKEEQTTVWSFKSRGSWATHNGNYRGNWSPYIPRNVIIKYSKENDLVLDCFCGAGTTGIECKLLNRNFIGIDINPKAIELAKINIDFTIIKKLYEESVPKIEFYVGDARDLSFIKDESIDLICTHPPYANAIQYTDNIAQDLSFCDVDEFLIEMDKVAKENYRVLKDGKYCAILIGDLRRRKHVVPLGFRLIDVYLRNGFYLKELVIKRQHNCKTTGIWYKRSIEQNFLLLAHEYLAIFKKDSKKQKLSEIEEKTIEESAIDYEITLEPVDVELESTTVWIFDHKSWYSKVIQNLRKRYSADNYFLINKIEEIDRLKSMPIESSLVVINIVEHKKRRIIYESIDEIIEKIKNNGVLAIICEDKRLTDGTILPIGIEVERILRNQKKLKIKEIVIISLEGNDHKHSYIRNIDNLEITHKYLLIYSVIKNS
jgi:DNA modification methylase